jgi:hypothetical protein
LTKVLSLRPLVKQPEKNVARTHQPTTGKQIRASRMTCEYITTVPSMSYVKTSNEAVDAGKISVAKQIREPIKLFLKE